MLAKSDIISWNKVHLWRIWGGHVGFQVFAEALYQGVRCIFRYSTDPTLKQSLQSRIVTYYHKHSAADATETFADKKEFEGAVLRSMTRCWNSCYSHPCLDLPDVVIEIYEDESGMLQWRLSHLSIYEDYLQQLRPLKQVLSEPVPKDAYKDLHTISIEELIYYGGFAGRGNTKLVGLRSNQSPDWVFKGLDFVKYLMTGSDFQDRRDACYHEIRTILTLPSYPTIISKNMVFVRAAERSLEPGICGALYPYMKDGTLKDEVNRATKFNIRLELAEKAKWCSQMTSAILHTHYLAQTYHMDVRPSKFLIDDKRDIILIDWEQSGASRCTIAPEADGSYDAEMRGDELQAKIFYRLYEGPERENNPSSWPSWNVFPIWRDKYSQALEAAEVFSLGRTMWMLLEQVDEGSPKTKIAMSWKKAYDLPVEWRVVVELCLDEDPNQRPTLAAVMEFWTGVTGSFFLPKPSDS